MRDVMERFVLLPFTAGCICEPSISVVMQNSRRPKRDANSTRMAEEEKGEEHEYMNDEESLSGESFKTDPPRFQKLFKNFKTFSQIFVYKDELEPEMGLEIGFPTDVKHVSHIGLDGRASSIFMEECNNVKEAELINRLHSFPLKQLELATPNMRRLLLGTQM